MRLTEKDYCGYDIKDRKNFHGYVEEEDHERLFAVLQKLGQLEDIEDELGIDLITLFKAFKKGIWIKVNMQSRTYNWKTGEDKETGDKIVFVKAPYKTLAENIGYFRRLFEKEFAQNYGKTWALTKEELK